MVSARTSAGSMLASILKAIITVVNGVVILGNNPIVDTAGRRHNTERLDGAINAPVVGWGQGITPNAGVAPKFASNLPKICPLATDLAPRARVAAPISNNRWQGVRHNKCDFFKWP